MKHKAYPANELETALNKIFVTVDPEGLIRIGAPSDEYGHEVRELIKQRNKCTNVRQTATIIADIFNSYFSSKSHKAARYTKVAKDVLKILSMK
jgi:hypothetical protein